MHLLGGRGETRVYAFCWWKCSRKSEVVLGITFNKFIVWDLTKPYSGALNCIIPWEKNKKEYSQSFRASGLWELIYSWSNYLRLLSIRCSVSPHRIPWDVRDSDEPRFRSHCNREHEALELRVRFQKDRCWVVSNAPEKKRKKHEQHGFTFCWISNTLPSSKIYVNNLDVKRLWKKLTF